MSEQVSAQPQLNPMGYQQLTISTTATALTVPTNAMAALVVVRTNSIRWRDDGTAPTDSVGMPYGASSLPQTFVLYGAASLANWRGIRISADAEVNVSYYGA